jgi:hypothetical protein
LDQVSLTADTFDPKEWNCIKQKCNPFPRGLVLEMAVRLSLPVPGNIIEFGVAGGQSARIIQKTLEDYGRVTRRMGVPKKQLFACDSFQGLTEKFENLQPGAFACQPPYLPGVEIVKGFFQDTLNYELAARIGAVSLAHLDADLYSSTLCALNWLTPLLYTGSLLLFDEFLGGDGSERRAFEDWCHSTHMHTICIAEFIREPSGHGEQIDRRMLFQVVGEKDLDPRALRRDWERIPWPGVWRRVIRRVRKFLP